MKKQKRNNKGRFKTKGKLKKYIIRVTLEEKELIEQRRKNEDNE
jgi:hypothetical protein